MTRCYYDETMERRVVYALGEEIDDVRHRLEDVYDEARRARIEARRTRMAVRARTIGGGR